MSQHQMSVDCYETKPASKLCAVKIAYVTGFVKRFYLCYRAGEISSPDVEIAGGIDEPYFPGNPGLFIGWVKPGSDADRLLSPGCQLTKGSGFFVNTKNYEYL